MIKLKDILSITQTRVIVKNLAGITILETNYAELPDFKGIC